MCKYYKVEKNTIIIKEGKKTTPIFCNTKQEAKAKAIELIADDNWEYHTKDMTDKEIDDFILNTL